MASNIATTVSVTVAIVIGLMVIVYGCYLIWMATA
jgi:fucose permease